MSNKKCAKPTQFLAFEAYQFEFKYLNECHKRCAVVKMGNDQRVHYLITAFEQRKKSA